VRFSQSQLVVPSELQMQGKITFVLMRQFGGIEKLRIGRRVTEMKEET
jgi:hypothetical protein